ncbi:MAG: protein TolR [Candidatus Competibacteraceae bacterium]|nr:protein TolR [Candidatus Competibacteraceae bacterium]MBK7984828.1 protein TolR [Candidatus Competibacteraceae bacterium]MBK8899409.1 protein TolR [Candidatus Competibacteraceae bacterium]MBK8964414.1 protein TolR [Candidatus Competibacteraceae bacterium]MBK9952403.1 protein TolR [Candidatus Competibacteraceae bacterium]
MARRSSHGRLKAEINIVPYIDVMLVLLVIFMVTAPLLNQGVEVDLPKAAAEKIDTKDKDTEVLVLSVQKGGSCYFNIGSEKAQTVNCANLEPRLASIRERLSQKPQPPVLVRADRELKYEDVIKAMTVLREAGAAKVGLSTAPPNEPPVRP